MKKTYIVLWLCCIVSFANAQWTTDKKQNTVVAYVNADINAPDIRTTNTNDGRTWIAFYSKNKATGNFDLRAQLLDVNGNRMFGDSGVLVSNKKSGVAVPDYPFNICVDKDNNLIIAFAYVKGNIYWECMVQKISTEGKSLWARDLGEGGAPFLSLLGTNEVVVAWTYVGAIHFQKLNAGGGTPWDTIKVIDGLDTSDVSRAHIVAGTNGKFSMVYPAEFPFPIPYYTNLYAQQFDNNGNALWKSPVKVSPLFTESYYYFDVISDRDTTYVGYYGRPSRGSRYDAYIQRINPDGSLPYGEYGTAFSDYAGANGPYEKNIYIAKHRNISEVWAVCTVTNALQSMSSVYVQKINALTGDRYFGNYAKPVFPLDPGKIRLISSKLSLADNTPIFLISNITNKIAAIRLNSNGGFFWADTVKVTGATKNPKLQCSLTNVYNGQCVAVWQEDKGNGAMPYAQNIKSGTSAGADTKTQSTNIITIQTVYPNPAQNDLTAVITSPLQTSVRIYVTTINGTILKQEHQNVQKGKNLVQLKVNDLKPGNYFIKADNENGSAAAIFSKQ